MKVFLAIGNPTVEDKINRIDGLKIIDSENNLDTLSNLLEFIDIDCLVINRLLDDTGDKLIDIARQAKARSIRLIVLVDSFESYEEKKLIMQLVTYDVFAFLKLNEISEDTLKDIISSYPAEFDFKLLNNSDKDVLLEDYITKTVRVGFKKLVLTVWDNAEFGCELAYIISKLTDHKVMLIDLDLLSPKADMILNIPKHPEGIHNQGIFTMSGLNIIMDAIEKEIFTPELLYEAAIRRNENKNLNILTGNYSLENYEYYSGDSLTKLIEHCYRAFEITILLAGKSIYDEYTFRALERSDYNIAAINADLPTLREYNSYLGFLKNIQQIPIDKTKFVAYEYIKGTDLEEKLINEVVEKNYIGSIRHSKLRRRYRSLKAPYVKRMEEQTRAEYIKLLASFSIVIKRTLKDDIKMHLNSTLRPLRRLLKRRFKNKEAS